MMSRGNPARAAMGQDASIAGAPAALRHAQLIENASGSTPSIIGNFVNGLVSLFLALAYNLPHRGYLPFFGLVLVLLVLWRRHVSRLILRSTAESPRLESLWLHIVINGAALGAYWGGVAYCLLAARVPEVAMFAGIIGAGMMSAGAITYRTMREAALAYVGLCAFGGLAGLVAADTHAAYAAMGLLACFMTVLITNIRANDKRFTTAHIRAAELSKSGETIQLLLNDFTEQGSDWRMEVDAAARLISPCARLAEASRRPLETLDRL
ncbi:MAG: hypothetical protein ACKOUM_11525, partial [Sphingopyxis sp.]